MPDPVADETDTGTMTRLPHFTMDDPHGDATAARPLEVTAP